MKRFLLSLGLAVAAVGVSQSSSAAVPGYPCHGCSPTQEEQAALAKPGLGARFIYNFTNHRLRKFAVYLDSARSTGTIDGVLIASEPKDFSRAAAAGRDLYEMVVDPGMVPIFTAADSLWAKDRSWFKQQAHRAELESVGQTPGPLGPRAFSPADVAWDGPGSGEGRLFMQRLGFMLSSRSTTAQLGNGFAEALHDVGVSLQNVTIEVGTEGGSVGVALADGPTKETLVEFCNSKGECIAVKITTTSNSIKAEFAGATDAENVAYPSSTERTIERRWGPGGREAAGDMGRFITSNRNGILNTGNVPANCGRIVLACSDAGTQYVCQMFCTR